ncbi:MFS transporter [Gloeobacter violaceus]|uniref:Glr3800 protein n=1 Tax=Gloeobacter violaceus (strain ATCC 29082 / PCC 7421) TaxID=251221 RepID=Q7NES8_GLOVI|nr:MFS transporter [Gloeobacter violaceus]BAC91741.1 glr3800 [Gloeobacter violaceus PCC 7421]
MKLPGSVPRPIWILGFVSLLTDSSSEMIHALLPLFLVAELGASVLVLGMIEGIAEATASLVKVFSGALSDYLGQRKNLAVAGYALSAAAKPLFALATSPVWVLVARFADRLGKGVRGAPRDALMADLTPPPLRGAAFGLRQSLDTVGACIGPLVAAVLMAASGDNFRLVFLVALVPGFAAVALLVFGVREPERPAVASRLNRPLRWADLGALGRPYWLLVLAALLFSLGNSSDAFLLLRSQQLGVAAALLPLLLLVMNVVYALSAYPVGVLSDRIGRPGLLAAGWLLYALVYLGFAFAALPWQVWGLFALYGLYLGITQGILSALIADRVPAHLRGTAFGFFNLATGVALLPASLLAGALWQGLGGAAPFVVGGGCALAATLLLVLSGIVRVRN